MSIETFYATASQLCFTLLGFWWIVVQFKHSEWSRNPSRRRMSHAVSMHFLLPGTMSLISILATDARFLWRVTFGVAGLLGIAATLLVATTIREETGNIRLALVGQWIALPLYALIALFAIAPELVAMLGIGLPTLVVEGIILSLLVFVGVNIAYLLFMEPVKSET